MIVLFPIHNQKSPNYLFRKSKTTKSRKKTTFSDCVYEIYRTSRVFGLLPFSLVFKNHEIVGTRVSALDCIWFIVSLTIYANLIYFASFELPWQMPLLLHYEHYIQLTSGLIRIMLSIILDMYNRQRIAQIIVDLIDFDKMV